MFSAERRASNAVDSCNLLTGGASDNNQLRHLSDNQDGLRKEAGGVGLISNLAVLSDSSVVDIIKLIFATS